MHRMALILTACLCMSNAGGEAPPAVTGRDLAVAGIVPLALPLSGKPAASEATSDPKQAAADTSPEAADSGAVREIVAGVLTGSLAAVLMLKLLYGRRRRDGSGPG